MSDTIYTTIIMTAHSVRASSFLARVAAASAHGARAVFSCLSQSEWGGVNYARLESECELLVEAWSPAMPPFDELAQTALSHASIDFIAVSEDEARGTLACVLLAHNIVHKHTYRFEHDGRVLHEHATRDGAGWRPQGVQQLSFTQATAQAAELHTTLSQRLVDLGEFLSDLGTWKPTNN